MEVWKKIKDYDYEVSNIGNVRNAKTFYVLKPVKEKWGYYIVGLSKNGKVHSIKLHRLVAETFIENPNNYSQVNHINENKTDNRVENLEWCTPKQNCNHGTRNERFVKTRMDRHPARTVYQYSLDGKLLNTFYNAIEASNTTGVAFSHIYSCCKGQKNYKTAGGFIWKN